MIQSFLKHVQGWVKLRGNSDETLIGNVGDRLKVQAEIAVISDPAQSPTILRQAEVNVTTRNATYITASTYTVPTGKTFKLTFFGASYDNQGGIHVRLKKQTGGTGSFDTIFRISIKQSPQEPATQYLTFPNSILVGSAGDVFKIEYEASIARGSLWAGFTGCEC